MATVRLRLERSGDALVVGYEREEHPVPALPLDGLEEAAARAELVALAAGIEAAVKFPAPVEDCDFRDGAFNLLPRVERGTFVRAYDAVLAGRDAPDEERLFVRELGAGLTQAYVRDEGWRFAYLTRAQVARWAVSPGTIDAGARSILYHRDEVPWDATAVHLDDGYDASRVALTTDVFYHLAGDDGVPVAVPGRDLLLVGDGVTAEAVAEAYAAARYPLCPHPLRFRAGSLTPVLR